MDSVASQLDLGQIEVSFPPNVYADVRIEHTVEHRLSLRDGVLDDVISTTESGALLRVLKEGRWYCASTTDLETIDAQPYQAAPACSR